MSIRIDLLLEYMKECDRGIEINLSEYFGEGLEPIFKYSNISSFQELEKILKKAEIEYNFISKKCLKTFYNRGYAYWVVKDRLIAVAYDNWDKNNNIDKFLEKLENINGKKFLFNSIQDCRIQLQKDIAENIKSKVIKSSTMQLEHEEVLEDNSVLLTIRV